MCVKVLLFIINIVVLFSVLFPNTLLPSAPKCLMAGAVTVGSSVAAT